MARTGRIEKKEIQTDPVYKSTLVAKLINKLMKDGKKTVAEKIVYEAFKKIETQGEDPLKTFEKAMDNVMPRMEVKPRRVGGASYMVPIEVRGPRRQSLAVTWLINAARSLPVSEVEKTKNKPIMINKLFKEIMGASQGAGKAVSKKEEMHRMAEANKAFAHFRW